MIDDDHGSPLWGLINGLIVTLVLAALLALAAFSGGY